MLILIALSSVAFAAEPAEEFIQGLQDRGLNELALEYLDRMQTSNLASEEFRQRIPYHRSVVLIEQSRRTADKTARARLLDEARSALERFEEANPGSALGAEAQLQLATVELSRGQQLIAQAAQLPTEPAYDGQRKSLLEDAREHFTVAREAFSQSESTYNAEIDKLPPASDASSKTDGSNLRQEYRARIAQLRFLAAQARFETAQSYLPDSDDYVKLHKAAAQELEAVHEEFGRTFIVGLYARLFEGRCYQALGQHAQAIGCYEEILSQPNVLPPFRKLIASAVHRKAETLIAQDKPDLAIEVAKTCLRDASATEEKQPEWLAVRYRLAEGYRKKGEVLPAESLEQRKLFAEARDAYRLVSNTPGEFQLAARTAVASLTPTSTDKRNQPRTFQAAYDAGKDALASYNAARLSISSAEKNNPDAIVELRAQMDQGREDARHYFQIATTLVDDDTDLKLLNEVRYFLCWLYWESEDYYRAAVLGEFLARRYPDHASAASAAKLAMASFERLYMHAQGGQESDTEFEVRRMAKLAEFVVRRWPNSADADAARSVLVGYAIRTNRIDEAEQLLAQSSPASRAHLELQLGNAIWSRYIELAQTNGDLRNSAEANQLKLSATKYLQDGLERARKDRHITDLTATASLYLAQSLLGDEKYDDAIRLLEDSDVGALFLVAKEHAAASRPQYAVEAYKAALRAYALATPPQAEKAVDAMRRLDEAVGLSGGNESQLVQIYISLGVALQKQLEALRDSGRTTEADRVAAAFATFLEKIADQQQSVNWATRVWTAQTYFNMSTTERTGPSANPMRLSDSQRRYIIKSRDAYQSLLDNAAQNPNLSPNENALLAVKLQLGECHRALGEYQLALDMFSDILKDKESSLSVQRAAAYTYQARGQSEAPQWLERAIHGGYKLKSTGQNRIWGWLKISQVALRASRNNEKYRDTFYEARVNIARCRYLAAIKRSGAGRQQDLAKAKQSIQSVAQLYPDLGGDRWRGEFDTLLKQIQSAAGEQANGLREFSAGQPASTRNSPQS